jgi:hypothetical protein
MADRSNVKRGNSQILINTLLQNLHSWDFITSYPASWQLPINISNENRNLDRLKTRIDSFFQEHPNIIMDIKNYFYDDMIIYILKRSFQLPFNTTDITKTERLLNRFFIEHEANIRIIFDYFFDDIKPFLVDNNFLSLTSELWTINSMLNRGTCETFIFLLKTKGAQFLTSLLYPETKEQNQNQTLPEQTSLQVQSTSNLIRFASILVCVCVLCIILGWKIFPIMFHFFIVLIIIVFFVHLLLRSHTI